MNLSEITLDREGLAAAIACEDVAFEAALRDRLPKALQEIQLRFDSARVSYRPEASGAST